MACRTVPYETGASSLLLRSLLIYHEFNHSAVVKLFSGSANEDAIEIRSAEWEFGLFELWLCFAFFFRVTGK